MLPIGTALYKKKKRKKGLDLDALAKALGSSPEALSLFEKKYKESIERADSDNFFDHSVKDLSQDIRTVGAAPDFDEDYLADIIGRIVDELVSCTSGFRVTDGNVTGILYPETSAEPVTLEEVNAVPEPLRPMLTGSLCRKDFDTMDGGKMLLYLLKKSMEKDGPYTNPFSRFFAAFGKKRRERIRRLSYCLFRQGLEILDLDPVSYEILGMNRNSIGFWLPPIAKAAKKEGFFKIPDTVVVKVPMPILQLTRLDYMSLNLTTLNIVDEWAMKVFGLDTKKDYFVKTGIFSSKFDFRNARVSGEKEVKELGEYLLLIQFQASQYASPLNMGPKGRPLTIYGAATTNQFAVREYIHDTEGNPCIYNGLPLHTEYRVFVEFGQNARILGISPYWRPDVMKKRFQETDENRDVHDYVTYSMHENVLMGRYEENKDMVLEHIRAVIADADLEGQWSIDVMQNGNDFYIIDMATADTSALSDCVPEGLIQKSPENWVPEGLLLRMGSDLANLGTFFLTNWKDQR